jgi:hypothetical protein
LNGLIKNFLPADTFFFRINAEKKAVSLHLQETAGEFHSYCGQRIQSGSFSRKNAPKNIGRLQHVKMHCKHFLLFFLAGNKKIEGKFEGKIKIPRKNFSFFCNSLQATLNDFRIVGGKFHIRLV